MLEGKTYLITGIADENSLAKYVANKENDDYVICTGLGINKQHSELSDQEKAFLNKTYDNFQISVHSVFGKKHIMKFWISLYLKVLKRYAKIEIKNIQLDPCKKN